MDTRARKTPRGLYISSFSLKSAGNSKFLFANDKLLQRNDGNTGENESYRELRKTGKAPKQQKGQFQFCETFIFKQFSIDSICLHSASLNKRLLIFFHRMKHFMNSPVLTLTFFATILRNSTFSTFLQFLLFLKTIPA